MYEDFFSLYGEVFNSNGDVKKCGREACKKLIHACNKVSTDYFGDEDTGIMNIESIHNLYNKLRCFV